MKTLLVSVRYKMVYPKGRELKLGQKYTNSLSYTKMTRETDGELSLLQMRKCSVVSVEMATLQIVSKATLE